MRLYVAAVSAMTLVMGFAVAASTGNRALAAVFLVLGWGWCARQWWVQAAPAVAVGLSGLFVALFALSHALAGAIGGWPSVILVSLVMGAASYLWVRPGPSGV